MPALDFASLSLLAFVSMVATALALPLAMGRQAISPAARYAQRYFLLQALAWVCILAASRMRGTAGDFAFATLATLAVVGAQWHMGQALQTWLGPREGMQWLQCCCIAGPVGFVLLWTDLPWRFAWFSLIQGMGLLLLAHMCLYPARPAEKGWRLMLCTCACCMAILLWTRAGVTLWRPSLLPDFAAQTWLNHSFVMAAHIFSIISLMSVMVAWRSESQQRLTALALTDMLTGVPNRRAFEEQAPGLLQQARRQQLPLALLMIDLDHFKTINDQHGHAVGDQALRLFAAAVQAQLRGGDMVARWGGEEFCLLVHAEPVAAETLYLRLRQAVVSDSQQALGFALRFSAGGVCPRDGERALDALVQRADTALYLAKQAGRDQLVFSQDLVSADPAMPMALPQAAAGL